MGTVTQKLQNILDCKVDIADAITSKGVPCDKDGILSEYADKIKAIEVVEPAEPKVGDIRKEGIVVYVDPTNPKRFLLMSKEEFNLAWRTDADATTKIDGLTLDNGKKNCEIIWSLPEYTSSPESFPTFKAAKEYKDGKWFVPSREEIDHVFEYLLDWHRGDKMGWPTPMPNYNKEEAILSSWESAGLLPIDVSSSTGVYWVSSQWEVKPNWWGEGVSESTFTSNGVTGGDPTTTKHVRFFKWVEPEAIKPKSYGGYTKDPNWPDFTKEISEDTEDYPFKAFMVLTDTYNSVTFPSGCKLARTSDNKVYTGDIELGESTIGDISAIHTWDRTKDSKDSKGRVIRWLKLYGDAHFEAPRPQGILYTCANFGPLTTWTSNYTCLECIEQTTPMQNIAFDGPSLKCIIAPNIDSDGNIHLKQFSVSGNTYFKWKWPKGLIFPKDCNTLFFSSPSAWNNIEYIEFDYNGAEAGILNYLRAYTLVLGPNFTTDVDETIFINNENLETLIIQTKYPNFQYLMSKNAISSTNPLRNVTIPDGWDTNLKLTGSYLTVSSLIGIMNALIDKTGTAAGLLTIGATNINKLSDEEKLIAINKNWTLS